MRIEGRESSGMATAQDDGGEEVRGRAQQSPLASQRAKENGEAGKVVWFPLSAKEGFNQWVRSLALCRDRERRQR